MNIKNLLSKKILYYLGPALLGLLIFSSNFLNPDIFDSSTKNFSVWFVLSLFKFACGWIINKTLGWVSGGKIVFAVIVATAIVSLAFVSFFSNFFSPGNLLTENLILYSLRNITLGLMSFFGMAVEETFMLQRENLTLQNKNECYERDENLNTREAEVLINESKVKADKIVFDAEKKAADIIIRKNRIEQQLQELLQIEREILRKYENEKD